MPWPGKVGTPNALPALKRASSRFFGDDDLFVTTELARRQIRSRGSGATPPAIVIGDRSARLSS